MFGYPLEAGLEAEDDMMRHWNSGRGFTLMELLVVIAIIAVLVAIVLGVATGVSNSGRASMTKDTIRVLETSLEDYSSTKGARPAYFIGEPRVKAPGYGKNIFPIADALYEDAVDGADHIINSCGLFIEQLREVSSAYDNIAGTLSSDQLKAYSPSQAAPDPDDMVMPLLPTAFDAWGNPIRYVHPVFDGLIFGPNNDLTDPDVPVTLEDDLRLSPPRDGTMWAFAEIRRNSVTDDVEGSGDSDGGICRGDHPYFYSAGPDGKVGFDDANNNGKLDPGETDFNEDNVYGSAIPTLQKAQ
jgi:prepilin-type N-terminal cleavage/methylation domain-containing protein